MLKLLRLDIDRIFTNKIVFQNRSGLANCRAFLFVMQRVKVYFCRFAKNNKMMLQKFKDKKWWKILLSIVVVAKILFVVFAVSSLKSDDNVNKTAIEEQFKSYPLPEKVTFAGEKMPLELFDVREYLDRELISNAYFHSQTFRLIKLAPRYFPLIEPILKKNGVPDDFKYLAMAESALNPRAVSPAGAVGFWQFLDVTAKEYGLEVNKEIDERYHVEKSTEAFCKYIKEGHRKFGNWTMAAAAYNGGMARVQRQMERQKLTNFYDLYFAEETRRYIYRIVAIKLVVENPETYNFKVEDSEKYPFIKTRNVEITGAVADFGAFAISQGINYKYLKDFNPWLRDDKLTNASRKKYTVKIPVLN